MLFVKFVVPYNSTTKPTTAYSSPSPKPTAAVQWTPAMLQAVEDVKRALSKATLLAHPAATAELGLAVDASAEHVGAALRQRASPAAAWQPTDAPPLLASLPARERRILVLRFFHGMTQTQISAEVGISQMHVSRLLAKSLGQLRDGMLED